MKTKQIALKALYAGPSMLHVLPRGEKCTCSECEHVHLRISAIRALEADLARVVEPVAWRVSFNNGESWTIYEFEFKPVASATVVPLYLAAGALPKETK